VPLQVTWLGHSTALLELDGARVLTDPVLGGRVGPLLRVAPPVNPEAVGDIDAVLLSHMHADHANLASLRRIGPGALVLAPQGAAGWLSKRGIANVHELIPDETLEIGPLRVAATPAVHDGRRHRLAPAMEAIGFTVRGSSAVYFAGDTDLFEGMEDLGGPLDLALLPVWGWGSKLGPGHLDPARAAHAAALLTPRVAIPIHWGTLALPRLVRGRVPGDRPALEFARLAARKAPGVEVRLLRPGEGTAI
jgi:L-ascorbate metabolism protein UlaG (beta-lactamase superfamily)